MTRDEFIQLARNNPVEAVTALFDMLESLTAPAEEPAPVPAE